MCTAPQYQDAGHHPFRFRCGLEDGYPPGFDRANISANEGDVRRSVISYACPLQLLGVSLLIPTSYSYLNTKIDASDDLREIIDGDDTFQEMTISTIRFGDYS
jgi:hypothetical protein